MIWREQAVQRGEVNRPGQERSEIVLSAEFEEIQALLGAVTKQGDELLYINLIPLNLLRSQQKK